MSWWHRPEHRPLRAPAYHPPAGPTDPDPEQADGYRLLNAAHAMLRSVDRRDQSGCSWRTGVRDLAAIATETGLARDALEDPTGPTSTWRLFGLPLIRDPDPAFPLTLIRIRILPRTWTLPDNATHPNTRPEPTTPTEWLERDLDRVAAGQDAASIQARLAAIEETLASPPAGYQPDQDWIDSHPDPYGLAAHWPPEP